jgi:hypothetical protein
MMVDLPQIYRSEGMEEIWSGKPAWGHVDDQKITRERSPEKAPVNIKDVYWRPQESGSTTMLNILLNILWRAEGERIESGSI